MKNKTETVYYGQGGDKLAIKDNIHTGKMSQESYWYSETSDKIQVAKMDYDKGKVFKNHKHNIYNRTGDTTQECLLVVCGAAKVKLYDNRKKLIDVITLRTGDFLILLSGYHELSIIENGTRLMEFKNGPYTSVEKDKTYYD